MIVIRHDVVCKNPTEVIKETGIVVCEVLHENSKQ